MSTPHDATLAQYEAAAAQRDEGWYELTLIVSGASELSTRAIANARRIGDENLGGRYHLSVVDLLEEPASVLSGQVLAAPTLVKNRPLPSGKFVGDLSRTDMVLKALGLPGGRSSGAAG